MEQNRPNLQEYESFKHKGKQYYSFSDKDIDKLVDMYFNDLSTKRKGFVGFFKWLGIDAYGTTHRGPFEYEEEYLDYVQSSINKCRKKYKINRIYDNKNLLNNGLFENNENKENDTR